MKVNRLELLKSLELLKPGLAQKEIIEQSTCFVFHEGRALTYNDEIAVSHEIDIDIEGAVKAKEMMALLNRMKDEEVDIALGKNDAELRVTGKRGKGGITLEAEILLPVNDINIPEKFKKLSKGFSEAVAFCVFSAGNDMSKPALTCVHMTGLIVESSDGYRITRYGLPDDDKNGFKKPILLPATTAAQLASFKLTKYAIEGSWIHFCTAEGTVVSCRTVEGNFPHEMITDYLEVEGTRIKFPDTLSEILGRAGIFTSEGASVAAPESVSIGFSGKKLTIRGEGIAGWYEESCRAKIEGDDFAFNIAPAYLQAIIDHGSTAIVGDRLLKFEGDCFEHAVMMIAEKAPVEDDDDIPF